MDASISSIAAASGPDSPRRPVPPSTAPAAIGTASSHSGSRSASEPPRVPSGWVVDKFGRQVKKEQTHYMRSCSRNPWVASPAAWESPYSVTRQPKRNARLALGKPRPVNRRNYYSPSHWVQQVEQGNAPPKAGYIDYSFTAQHTHHWQERIKKERQHSRGCQRLARGSRQAAATAAPDAGKAGPSSQRSGSGRSLRKSDSAPLLGATGDERPATTGAQAKPAKTSLLQDESWRYETEYGRYYFKEGCETGSTLEVASRRHRESPPVDTSARALGGLVWKKEHSPPTAPWSGFPLGGFKHYQSRQGLRSA